MSIRLYRPAAVLLGLEAILCFLLGASSLPYAFALDPGVALFFACMAVLYGLGAVRVWRRDVTGKWLAMLVLVVWGATLIREGRLPSAESVLAFVVGPVFALATWHDLNVSPSRSAIRINVVVVAGLALLLLGAAPLWHCHEGFGGIADFHCHSIVVHPHAH